MKVHATPTTRERYLGAEDFIVSKTDTKGRITYGNRKFIELSGYTELELLNKNHNIVRHPDMPRGVFKFLWDTIAAGNECRAYVKNLAKDGSFYWVFATVTPSYDAEGNIIGYYSVRRAPKREAVNTLEGVYKQMLAIEQSVPTAQQCDASIAFLVQLLTDKGVSYEDFIQSL